MERIRGATECGDVESAVEEFMNATGDKDVDSVLSPEEKSELVTVLYDRLRQYASQDEDSGNSWTHSCASKCLSALRFCARGKACIEEMREDQKMKLLASLARGTASEEVAAAATKVIVNVHANSGEDRSFISEDHMVLLALHVLQTTQMVCDGGQIDERSHLMFPYLRFLMIISMQPEPEKRLREAHIEEVLATFLEKGTESVTGADSDAAMTMASIIEVLRIIYHLLMHLGPLGAMKLPDEREEALCTRTYLGCRLTHAYQHYLFLPNQPTYAAIKNAAVMAMINLPAMTVNMFPPERTLAAVLDVLQTQLHMAPPDDLDSPSKLIPSLVILTSIAKGIPRSRPIIKNVLFPGHESVEPGNGVEVPPAYKDPSVITSKFLPHMMAINQALSHYTAELVYTICNEDAKEMNLLCGLGHAAGFFQSRGLFGQLQGLKARRPEGSTSERREPTEEEAREWMEKLDRLEKKGFVKVVRKGDKDGE